jgi:citrate synthase
MQIGKDGPAVSHICQAFPDRVEVRGRDLTGEVMGSLTFTEYFHLLLTGRQPTEDQRYFLDLLLVAIAEHGMMPTNVAARMTLAAAPESLQGAVAAGLLGCGPVILGTSESCALLLEEAQGRVLRGAAPGAVAGEMAEAIRTSGGRARASATRCTGRSIPVPSGSSSWRTNAGVSGPHVVLARCFREAVAAAWGRPLTMNVSMPQPP